MSGDNTSNTSDNSFMNAEVSLPRPVRFWLMLLFNIPSVICSFCLIFHILINRTQRHALQNHTILVMLIFGLPIQLIDVNFSLVFFHYGSVQPSQPIVCLLWWLADIGFYNGVLMLMCWLAIERHILIFHHQWVSNQRGRILFHYLPLIIIMTYILLFYMVVIFFPLCEDIYVYTVPICGESPCYQSYSNLSMFELIVHSSIPIILESIFSTGLLIRVQLQKRRLHQRANWQKHRRMIIQLSLASGINVSLNLPVYLIFIAHLCGLPSDYGIQAQLYFIFLSYFVTLLFPFISLCQFPDLRKKIKTKILVVVLRQENHGTAVGPAILTIPVVAVDQVQ